MSVFRLAFKSKKDGVVGLPAVINKDTGVEDLKAFASENGYGTSKWGKDHDKVLGRVFEKATIVKADDIKDPLKDIDWTPFKQAIEEESGLFALPWEVFEKRIKEGTLNAILDGNNKLVATMNAIPKFSPEMKAVLGISKDDKSDPQFYETGAGWFARQYRGLGLYHNFRKTVLEENGISDRLIVSQARGKGATSVNRRDGWTLVNFNDFPMASCFLGWPTSGPKGEDGFLPQHFQLASGPLITLPKNGYYGGSTIKFSPDPNGDGVELRGKTQRFLEGNGDYKGHKWDEWHHLMTNDLDKLVRLEFRLMRTRRVIVPEDLVPEDQKDKWKGVDSDPKKFEELLQTLKLEDLREVQDRIKNSDQNAVYNHEYQGLKADTRRVFLAANDDPSGWSGSDLGSDGRKPRPAEPEAVA